MVNALQLVIDVACTYQNLLKTYQHPISSFFACTVLRVQADATLKPTETYPVHDFEFPCGRRLKQKSAADLPVRVKAVVLCCA